MGSYSVFKNPNHKILEHQRYYLYGQTTGGNLTLPLRTQMLCVTQEF